MQGDRETAALRLPRLVAESSTEALDDLPGHGKAETRALTIRLGRKKRLEDPLAELLGDARTFVVYVDVHGAIVEPRAHVDC